MSSQNNQNEKSNSKNLNILIPKLINKSNKYTSEIKKRIRINSIFNEFENKSKNEFDFYLQESSNRYKKTRSGASFDSVMKSSIEKYKKEGNKILNDEFFNLNLNEEKKSIKQLKNGKLLNKIGKIMFSIKDNINLMKPIKLDYFNDDNNNNNNETNDFKIKKKENLNFLNFDEFENQKNYISNVIKTDQNFFNNQINYYESYLNTMREKLNNSEEKQIKNNKKEDNFFPDLKLLNYNKIKPIKFKKKKEDFINIDLKKLLKYSKQGKNLNYNIFSIKNRKNNNNNNKKIINTFPFITQTCYELNDNFNYNDTINLVKNNANNGMLINDIFNQKKKILDNKLDIKNLPTLTFYEREIKSKTNKIKEERQKKNKEIGEKQAHKIINESEFIIKGIEEKREKWNEMAKNL
jgi:hypothetical protein